MTHDPASEKTTVLATYLSRQEAEIAATLLQSHGIHAHVIADDVHPPLQMTEGARLLVMAHAAEEAAGILRDNAGRHWAPAEKDTSVGGPVRATAWAYVVVFVLIVAAVAAGFLLT